MSDTPGSLIRHAAAAACLSLALVVPAAAQPVAPPPSSLQVFPRYDFHLSALALSNSDRRFSWDTHFGGELDVVDYGTGRVTFLVDFAALLGNDRRPFDPMQGTYILEASASVRLKDTEMALLLNHTSRHLSDRLKEFSIDWNLVGVRVGRQVAWRNATIDLVADAGGLAKRSFVDYSWIASALAAYTRPLRPNVALLARGGGRWFGVDDAIGSRGTQAGGSFEIGVRLMGTAGGIELVAGYERRVDADPIDFQPENWAFVGFRLVSQ
jgi:hypothetical protein